VAVNLKLMEDISGTLNQEMVYQNIDEYFIIKICMIFFLHCLMNKLILLCYGSTSNQSVVEIRYPPYSSDLVAVGNWQVLKTKIAPTGRRFQNIMVMWTENKTVFFHFMCALL
jgi:hypothetical protein